MIVSYCATDGPPAIRYPRGTAPAALTGNQSPLLIGRGAVLREGDDAAILALGAPKAEGVSVRVVNLRFIKPLDVDIIRESAEKTGRLLTVEENSLAGGCSGRSARFWPAAGSSCGVWG